MKKEKAGVTKRSLIQRINRRLWDRGEILRVQPKRLGTKAGEYMRVDLTGAFVKEYSVDLNSLAKELSVLKPWEAIEEK